MRLSVIIPVYNEQESINSTIKRVKSISECEIIVSDANTETLKVINDKSVKGVTSSKGRGNQMNAGAQSASGDVFLFLHADTVLPDNFEDEISKALLTHQAGAFRLSISSSKPVFRMVERLVHIRNRITKTPYGDQGIFCTREAFETVGGYRDFPIMEDVRLMEDFKRMKISVYLSDIPILTSARRWEKEGFLYTNFRNWTIISLYKLGVSPHKLLRFYK